MNNPPTCEQLRQAFEALAVRDHALDRMGFEQAMQHRTWRGVIAAKAAKDRADRYKAITTRRVRLEKRINPRTGKWSTQRVPGAFDETQPLIV
jgi:hypothetical protein